MLKNPVTLQKPKFVNQTSLQYLVFVNLTSLPAYFCDTGKLVVLCKNPLVKRGGNRNTGLLVVVFLVLAITNIDIADGDFHSANARYDKQNRND